MTTIISDVQCIQTYGIAARVLWTCRKQMRFLLIRFTVTIKVSSAYSQITCRSGCFRCWRRRRRENLRAQTKASMAASPSRFTILFPAILHTKTHYNFRFLATVPWNWRRHRGRPSSHLSINFLSFSDLNPLTVRAEPYPDPTYFNGW